MQSIPLYNVVSKWRDALANNDEIEAFCQEKYGKSPTIFVGLDIKCPPTETDCPFIILTPGAKAEGADEADFQYAASVAWSVLNESVTKTGNIVEYDGVKEVNDLGQLIYKALDAANPNIPVASVNYDTDSIEHFPQHDGEMMLTIMVTPAIGGTLEY